MYESLGQLFNCLHKNHPNNKQIETKQLTSSIVRCNGLTWSICFRHSPFSPYISATRARGTTTSTVVLVIIGWLPLHDKTKLLHTQWEWEGNLKNNKDESIDSDRHTLQIQKFFGDLLQILASPCVHHLQVSPRTRYPI